MDPDNNGLAISCVLCNWSDLGDITRRPHMFQKEGFYVHTETLSLRAASCSSVLVQRPIKYGNMSLAL